MTHETNDPPARDPGQIMLGAHWDKAFREVGLIPKDVFTVGGCTLRFGTRNDAAAVMLDVPIVLPFDKFKAAFEIVTRLHAEDVERIRALKARGLEGEIGLPGTRLYTGPPMQERGL